MSAERTNAGGAGADEIEACYRLIAARREVRNGFRPDPIGHDVLTRILAAAHRAPSVGLSMPWDFIVLRGEGSGALASPIVQSAVRVLHDVATFDRARVSGAED
jgi:nitroreductase